VLQKVSEQVAECLRRAAEAEACAERTNDAKNKIDYQRMADTWRTLARSYEFQGSLGRFVSFNKKRQNAFPCIPASNRQTLPPADQPNKPDFLDWLARVSERIRHYSAAALGIAIASVAIATLLRFLGVWAFSHAPNFAIYFPAILAAGLLAGVPAALGVAIASILIIAWAFMPPYFEFQVAQRIDQINILFNAGAYLLTVYFAHLCRAVLQRLRRGELNNRILVKELEHRGRNVFSVIDIIVQKTLAHDPESARDISGRLRSIQYANDLLTGKTQPVTIKELLLKEFTAHGENRLHMRGSDFDVGPESARHLVLLFHELTTNAAKHGSLSCPNGQVFVDWRGNGGKIALTWKECGGPSVKPPNKRGFGSQLLDTCIKSLSGTRQEDFGPDGYTCTLTFKVKTNCKSEGAKKCNATNQERLAYHG